MFVNNKPITYKNYGSIPHLPGSRVGPAEHTITGGQLNLLTVKTRDKHDKVFVEEKLDGSNVGIIKLNDDIVPLTRNGYAALTSPYKQHHRFADWALRRRGVFLDLLHEGERVVGEWLDQAHGTKYKLPHDRFVAFDIMTGAVNRVHREKFFALCHSADLITPKLLHSGDAISIEEAMRLLGDHGHHGAIDKAEGVVYRLERTRKPNRNESGPNIARPFVEFLAKYVRADKVDGCYILEDDGNGGRRQVSQEIWNEYVEHEVYD